MNGRTLRIALLGLLGALLVAGSLGLGAQDIPADKKVITFTGKLGTVTFNHDMHAQLVDVGGVAKVE